MFPKDSHRPEGNTTAFFPLQSDWYCMLNEDGKSKSARNPAPPSLAEIGWEAGPSAHSRQCSQAQLLKTYCKLLCSTLMLTCWAKKTQGTDASRRHRRCSWRKTKGRQEACSAGNMQRGRRAQLWRLGPPCSAEWMELTGPGLPCPL